MTILSPNQFEEQLLANRQSGDTVFHGMLYPGVYPTDFDQDHYKAVIEDRHFPLENPFFNLCHKLIDSQVRLAWLRVMPTEKMGYSKLALSAIHKTAIGIAEATKSDMRLIDIDAANRLLDQAGLESNPLTIRYRQGIAEQSPKSSFWRIDTPQQAAARVSIINYTGPRFDGHQLHEAPVDNEIWTYTNFWKRLYNSRYSIPVSK
jgi:hypothetical protein